MLRVSLKVAGQDLEITSEKGAVSVSGGDEFFNGVARRLAESAIEEYSPAMGGKASYVANAVVALVGGKVALVDEPLSEEGVVY